MTIGEAMREWAEALANAGCPEPEREALLIAAHVLSDEPGRIAAQREKQIPPPAARSARKIVEQRLRRVPLQYLLSQVEFYGLPFRCDPRALIPRPETELLVDAVLEEVGVNERSFIADIGTGCGCIAIALAVHRPAARFIATDISPAALSLARENAAAHGVDERIQFLQGDLLAPLVQVGLAERIDVLVANLPYVAEGEWHQLAPEVHHEPHQALVSGPTGVEAYARLAAQLHLLPRLRLFVIELSATCADRIRRQFIGRGFEIQVRRDLVGHERVLIGRRNFAASRNR